MSKKEMDAALFRFERPTQPGFKAGPAQYVNTPLPPEQQGEAVCFDLSGQWTNDEKKCAAKRVADKSRQARFFIKWCLDGPDKGHPLNPYSIYFKEGDENRMDPRRGRQRYEFKVVTENVFNLYISFLKTKMASYCQAAEREILNG